MPTPLPASEAGGIAVEIGPIPDIGSEMSEAGARLIVWQAWRGRGKVAKELPFPNPTMSQLSWHIAMPVAGAVLFCGIARFGGS